MATGKNTPVSKGLRGSSNSSAQKKPPSLPRSSSRGGTSARGYGAAPVGPLGRIPNSVRNPGNGAKQYKGG